MTKTPDPITISPGDSSRSRRSTAQSTPAKFYKAIWTSGRLRPRQVNGLAVHIGEITDATTFVPGFVSGLRRCDARPTSGTEAAVSAIYRTGHGHYLVLVASFDTGFDGTGTYRLTMTKTAGAIMVSSGRRRWRPNNGAPHTGQIVQGDLDVWTFTGHGGERIACTSARSPTPTTSGRGFGCGRRTAHSSAEPSGTDAAVIDDCRRARDRHLSGAGRQLRQRLRRHRHVSADDDAHAGADHGVSRRPRRAAHQRRASTPARSFRATSMCGRSPPRRANGSPCTSAKSPTPTTSGRGSGLWAPNGATLGALSGRTPRRRRCHRAGHGHLSGAGRQLRQRLRRHRHVSPHDDAHAGPDHGLARRPGRAAHNGALHTGEILQGDLDVWTFTATAGERIARAHRRDHRHRRLPAVDPAVGAERRAIGSTRPARTPRRSSVSRAGDGHYPCSSRASTVASTGRHVPAHDDAHAGPITCLLRGRGRAADQRRCSYRRSSRRPRRMDH